jgi:hypothetical protein
MATTACPICKSPADEIEPGMIDGVTYRCPRHNEFGVADSVLNTPAIMSADADVWESALKTALAKAAPGERPRILTYYFPSAG